MSISSEISRLQQAKSDIAAAIGRKGVTVPGTATLSAYDDSIDQIQQGVDTSDATADAAKILSGYTAYVNGEKVSGSIATYGETTSITPSTSSQTLYCAGKYMPSNVTVYGDSDLISANIRKFATVFGVTGSYGGPNNNYFYDTEQYGDSERVEFDLSFEPSCAFGYAKLRHLNDRCRMFCWCKENGDQGIFVTSSETISTRTFTVDQSDPTKLTFIPNGTYGTYVVWIK